MLLLVKEVAAKDLGFSGLLQQWCYWSAGMAPFETCTTARSATDPQQAALGISPWKTMHALGLKAAELLLLLGELPKRSDRSGTLRKL